MGFRATQDTLLTRIKAISSEAFEHLAVKLLANMGYSDLCLDAKVVGRSGDQGIDGVIRRDDPLGTEVIYVQAKRWDGTVGRPDVQRFVGALHGQRAGRGVLITTGTFSKGAREYSGQIAPLVVRLIDGAELVDLLIQYQLVAAVGELQSEEPAEKSTAVDEEDHQWSDLLDTLFDAAVDHCHRGPDKGYRIDEDMIYLAIRGLPASPARHSWKSILRLSAGRWLKIIYSSCGGDALPYGPDNVVIYWLIHMAVTQNSPVVCMDQSNPLLEPFGLSRVIRLAMMVMTFFEGPTEESLKSDKTSTFLEKVRFIAGSRRDKIVLAPETWWSLRSLKLPLVLDAGMIRRFQTEPMILRYVLFLAVRGAMAQSESIIDDMSVLPIVCDSLSSNRQDAMKRLLETHDTVTKYLEDEHGSRLLAEWEVAPLKSQDYRLRILPGLLE